LLTRAARFGNARLGWRKSLNGSSQNQEKIEQFEGLGHAASRRNSVPHTAGTVADYRGLDLLFRTSQHWMKEFMRTGR
jgi:hypothetical protein